MADSIDRYWRFRCAWETSRTERFGATQTVHQLVDRGLRCPSGVMLLGKGGAYVREGSWCRTVGLERAIGH